MIEGAFERAIGGAHKIHLPAEDANIRPPTVSAFTWLVKSTSSAPLTEAVGE